MASGEEKMRVAIMGTTGSGKSTFINVASGSKLPVSDSLESCTIDVETSTFSLGKQSVTLIDTPGFDDTTRSDTDILKSITDYLASSYSEGVKLAGVIYMHRITDNKMGGPSRRNFHIFRNLCGDAGLRNVLLVTTMWSKVNDEDGEAREWELASKEKFFKSALDRGARMLRHDGSRASAHAILEHLVDREPSTLLIQDEMVNQEKDLAHTTAGADVMRELGEQAERHAEALEDLCLGIEAARDAEDEELRALLQEDARKAKERIERIRGDLERMVANFATENSRLEGENRRYRKQFRRQTADAEHKARLFERERMARELAEAEKGRVEAQLTAERESRERERMEREKQEHERQEQNRREHDRREREKQEKEKQECERQEHERQEREKQSQWQEAADRAQKEQVRLQKKVERLTKEKEAKEKENSSIASCLIQ